jgi:hypothetical protein
MFGWSAAGRVAALGACRQELDHRASLGIAAPAPRAAAPGGHPGRAHGRGTGITSMASPGGDTMSDDGVVLYDPTAEPKAIEARLAARLATLEGKRVGILDNSKANAGTLMLAVARRLQERHGAGDIVKREKPVAGPPSPSILADLERCDFALVGSAD